MLVDNRGLAVKQTCLLGLERARGEGGGGGGGLARAPSLVKGRHEDRFSR